MFHLSKTSSSFIIFLVLGVASAAAALDSHAATTGEAQAYQQSSGALKRLISDPNASRERWEGVIESFRALHAEGRDPRGVRSLLMAGRASMTLYRRMGQARDLDAAIAYFNSFKSLNPSGPNLIVALRELKTAHLLKLKIITHRPSEPLKPRSFGRAWPATAATAKPYHHARLEGRKQAPVLPGAPARENAVSPNTNPAGAANPEVHPPSIPGPETGASGAMNLGSSPSNSDAPVSFDSSRQGNPYRRVISAPSTRPIAPARRASIAPRAISDAAPTVNEQPLSPKEARVIVIDPGHGGRDPGAVSRDGHLKEKDIVLAVAKRLKVRLQKRHPCIKVVLTREDDRSLSLKERTSVANSLNSDLFISLHCNSDTHAGSKGVETYYLSKASSRGAMRVAARENGISLEKMSDLEATLVDLMVTSKKTESDKLARTVHTSLVSGLSRHKSMCKDRGVRGAPFYVLLGAKMPAVLVECAFISNSGDEDKLASPQYLDSIAEGLASGADAYLHPN